MPKTAERPGESRAFRFSPDFQSALTALLAGFILPTLLLLAALTGLLAALLTTLLTTLVLLAALLLLLIVLVRIVHEVSCGLA
jgi:Flp pilus assembly protein TadB